MPDRPTIAESAIRISPVAGHSLLAEAGDQPAGEEARPEHGQDMPLDAQRRRADRQAAADHREGRRRHHEAHQAVGDEARDDGDDEPRLRDDLAQRPAAAALGVATTRAVGRRNETTTIASKASAACPRKAPAKGVA